jgi:hypothetical protein
LRHALDEYMAYCYQERNPQGLGNRLIELLLSLPMERLDRLALEAEARAIPRRREPERASPPLARHPSH